MATQAYETLVSSLPVDTSLFATVIAFSMAATDNPTIRLDESLGDTDSSYGDDCDRESQTTSLYSAITKYVYKNGRRYHSYRYGTYWY